MRLFGIGAHKTGTCSLTEAMERLGYKTRHFDGTVIDHILRDDLENYAFARQDGSFMCDLPFPCCYPRFDEIYPGSKFILTVRDEEAWLASTRSWWAKHYRQGREFWDRTVDHAHTLFYGIPYFDENVFLSRYRRHNRDVLEYFGHRLDDLLVLDIPASADPWRGICEFLGVPRPSGSFPHENRQLEYAGHSPEQGKRWQPC